LLAEHRAAARHALIVTDGVFSMDGDRAPLDELVGLARQFDAWTYVDDAHAVGVVGEHGRGTASVAGLEGQIDVTIGTLGKAFGAAGAFVYGGRPLRDFLINTVRSFIFSTGPLPAQAAAARVGLAVARDEPARRARIVANAASLRTQLRERGIACLGDDGAHIVPIVIGEADATIRVGDLLRADGYLVGAVRPPTVPPGTSRLRVTVSAAHDGSHIAGLADAIERALDTVRHT
jgi:7-keto-8-aminopelargonate synthetase-like enzyme